MDETDAGEMLNNPSHFKQAHELFKLHTFPSSGVDLEREYLILSSSLSICLRQRPEKHV